MSKRARRGPSGCPARASFLGRAVGTRDTALRVRAACGSAGLRPLGQFHRLHPHPQLVHNIQFRVLRTSQRRVMATANPVILALVDMYRAGPFITRNAVACEVVEPEVAHLQVSHLGDAQKRDRSQRCSQAGEIPSNLRRRVGLQASSRTTTVRCIGSLRERGRPVTEAIERFQAVSSPPPVDGRRQVILAVTRLNRMPYGLYKAGRCSMRDEIPDEHLKCVRAHRQQELYRLPRDRPRHGTRPIPPVLCARPRFRPRRPNVFVKLRRQVRQITGPIRPAQMTDSQLPVAISPFQRPVDSEMSASTRPVSIPSKMSAPAKRSKLRTIRSGPWPHLMMRPSLAPTRTTALAQTPRATP